MNKKRKIRDYIFWGAIAFFLNIGMFKVLMLCGFDYRFANILALLFNRIFTYVTNKLFVFKTKCKNYLLLIKEIASFFTARMITLFLDYFGVCLLVEVLDLSALYSKVIVSTVVIITNYFLSEWVVFKK